MSLRKHSRVLTAVVTAVAAMGVLHQQAWADCYPSGLKLGAATITSCTPASVTYVLNENADGISGGPGVVVKIKKASDNSVVRTINYAAPVAETRKGVHTVTWDKKDDSNNPAPDLTSYYFEITTNDDGHTASPSWDLISDDASNLNKYNSPRGVDVNRNPSSPNYGRIYVSNSAAGTPTGGSAEGDGIYIRNADTSDADGQGFTARTGGIDWTTSTSSPLRVKVGPDDKVYITDWSNTHGGLWVSDPNIGPATQVLGSVGGGAAFITATNGAISGINVFGSLGTSDLRIYTMDQDHGGSPLFQSVWRYNIGAGPLTWPNQPDRRLTDPNYSIPHTGSVPGTYVSNGTGTEPEPNGLAGTVPAGWLGNFEGPGSGDDMDINPVDGKIFVVEQRATGTATACSGLLVFSADDGSNVSTLLYDSLYDTRNNIAFSNTANDTLVNVISVAVALDGSKVAVLTTTQVILIPLVNGLPNLPARQVVVPTFVANGRQVCWDKVGNLYVVSSGTQRMRVYSPPDGANTNTTQSGNFTLNGVGSGGPSVTGATPASQSVCLNTANVQFSVSASGTGALIYQWLKNGTNLSNGGHYSGVTTNTLTINPADDTDVATYQCSVCDTNGVTLSATASLSIFGLPAITQSPASLAKYGGQSASFTGTATSNASPNTLTYQWRNGVPPNGTDVANSARVTGATTTTLTINGIITSDGGNYYLRVTDSCGRAVDTSLGTLVVLGQLCNHPFADADGNGIVDMSDFGAFQRCYTGATNPIDPALCGCFDRDNGGAGDGDVDGDDMTAFIVCADVAGGHQKVADPNCDGGSLLYTEDFDADHTANWMVNKSKGANANDAGNSAEFFYDYSVMGIPPAPNPIVPNDTSMRGLRLRANFTPANPVVGTLTGVSVSPIDNAATPLNFTGNYTVEFDAWMNFNGPLGTGNTGSSQITEFGIGSSGTKNMVPGGLGGDPVDSITFALSGDGQNGADYRAYTTGFAASYQDGATNPDGTFIYAAGPTQGGFGDRNSLHPYYSFFGGTAESNGFPPGPPGNYAPPAQVTAYPALQTGNTRTGACGFKWRHMKIIKTGTLAVWFVDKHLIATVELAQAGALGGGDVLFGQSDVNATSVPAGQEELVFGLIDNVKVAR